MSYTDFLDADRRLVILRLLIEDAGCANESVIERGLEALGHRVGLDRPKVRAYLTHLEQAGCLTIEYFRDKVMVANITPRGVKVAKGQISVDGVAKPALGE